MPASMPTACGQLYATMLLSDSYLPGALVLGHSLRDAGTKRKLAALVTLDHVSADAITQLKAVYDFILPVSRIQNPQPSNLSLMNRPDLHSAFTKINLWKLVQFSKIVYIDADVIAYRAPDELFDLPHAFSAAPDVGWPDIVNTGVMVLTPNMGDYYAMLAMAERGISFDGADQGLINMHFKHNTNRLPFTYNVTPSAHYQYIPAYLHFQSSISMVHFIGANKPWFSGRSSIRSNDPVNQMIGRWWAVHDRHYRTQPSSSVTNQQHEPHEPDTLQVNVANEPFVGGTAVHTRDDRDEKNNTDYALLQARQEDPSSGPDVTTTSHNKDTSSENSVCSESVENHPMETSCSPMPMSSSWDAQRQSPPPNSKPEAVNFPSAHYEMSHDTSQFVPPVRYPSPPKNMWYAVPEQPLKPAGKPRQIFPWEAKQPTASRSFTEPPVTDEPDQTSSAAEGESSEDAAQDAPQTTGSSDFGEPMASVTTEASRAEKLGSAPAISGDPWGSFSRANAWDEVPAIGRYVEGIQKHRRANSANKTKTPASAMGPSATSLALRMPRALRVTDFPTEIERPSLPVTPAPIKRPSFWGQDDDAGVADEARRLPAAEGVPSQSDWDPAAQLQKLAQQQSEVLLRRLSGDDVETAKWPSQEVPSGLLILGSETGQSPIYATLTPEEGVFFTPQPVSGKPVAATKLVEGLADANGFLSEKHDEVAESTSPGRT